MLVYLKSYLCKLDNAVSQLMKKASKETYGKDIKDEMVCIGNTYLVKREVSTHEAIKRVFIIFTYEVFKYRCLVCFYRSKKE